MHPPRWSLAVGILAATASGQLCYWPNGKDASLVACPVANGTAAACCFADHYCMSNGVCFSNTDLSFYRGACTAKDWSTSGCPTYCDKEDVAGAVLRAHVGIAKCTNKQYACQSTSNCATDSFEVPVGIMLSNLYLKSDIGVVSTASTVSTAGTPSATATSVGAGGATEATCTSTPAAAAASSGISTGAAAGIGVGVGAPLALAAGLLTVLLLHEKKKTRAALSRPVYSEIAPTSPWAKSEHTTYAPVEIPTQAPPPELPSDHRGRHELS
ncbi:hypothetical protein CGRA01v4_12849 [Colletotrichum graminicola]|uniref:Uncharacterized protein n=1 Tax=Colletotrichum graminicola (strain M1.001 / M2 / FGSC 10212) TaxID=645133 RepID=E3QIW3_COLGM|nr:uncharacterized protein GLRG_05945 [Colletotrichum graminicola M1.001]EFQ30801.1 hypothetical protein GLRG_05945 [Colletotrichum graminicola M1.001]WDK21559.1 hypothetical protein CGRA01v4_12849 [Colletotrichum graminicola]